MPKERIIYNTIFRLDVTVAKAEGSFFWDDKGKKYIDFASGWNVANLGWNHPEVNEAVREQMNKNAYVPMWMNDPAQLAYAEALAGVLPKGLNKFARATGGTEANEMALKVARATTGRKKIIGFWDTYHGQSFGTLAIGRREESVKTIAPLVPDFVHMEYPGVSRRGKNEQEILADFLNELEKMLSKKDVAAIITESGMVTGWGDASVAPHGFLAAVRKLTKQYGTLLIVDEVGTGFSRIGKLFGIEVEHVVPDMLTLAKGISNGAAAMGALAAPADMLDPLKRSAVLISTFGWTSAACAAAQKTLEIHKRDRVWEQAAKKGEYVMGRLKKEFSEDARIKDIRGIGLEIGIEFSQGEATTKVLFDCLEKGLNLIGDSKVIQLMPPLTMEDDVLKEATDILVDAIKES